jgi:hypothetical protein
MRPLTTVSFPHPDPSMARTVFWDQFVTAVKASPRYREGPDQPAYQALLQQPIFAFVPRGDCLFSYRFLEVISFGCIPIVLADGWILPFDRIIRWDGQALHLPETWRCTFATWDGLVETLFQEIDLMRQRQVRAV